MHSQYLSKFALVMPSRGSDNTIMAHNKCISMSETEAATEEVAREQSQPLTLTAEDGPIELVFRDGRVEDDDAFIMPEE